MKCEALVIGSGAGGAAAAYALARRGVDVLLAEAGPWYDPASDYRLDRENWETPFPAKMPTTGMYRMAELQNLGADVDDLRSWNHVSGRLVNGKRRQNMGYHHVIGVGGSTLHYTGEAHRINPRAMRMRTDFGVAADWPVTYNELEPYYIEAEDITGVAGPQRDLRCPRSKPFPQKPHRPSYAAQRIAEGMQRTGLTPVSNSVAILSAATNDRPACNGCGGCLRGCPLSDKGSADATFLPRALATGACRILDRTEVIEITSESKRRVSGVRVLHKGEERFISAKHVILAAGAVHSPRLLLVSASSEAPGGLANGSGQVGRNFMETLFWTSAGIAQEDLASHRGRPVDIVAWDRNAPDAIPGVIGGCRFGPAMAESDLVGPVAYARRVVKGWGADHKTQMRATFGKALAVTGLCESLPHEKSRVSLAPGRDRQGRRAALIHSHLDAMAVERIRFMSRTCRAILKATGAGDLFEEHGAVDLFNSTHVFGTCRMGTDARLSVVDAKLRSHAHENLYVMDASVFPSSGGGESPALTIQALALRAVAEMEI